MALDEAHMGTTTTTRSTYKNDKPRTGWSMTNFFGGIGMTLTKVFLQWSPLAKVASPLVGIFAVLAPTETVTTAGILLGCMVIFDTISGAVRAACNREWDWDLLVRSFLKKTVGYSVSVIAVHFAMSAAGLVITTDQATKQGAGSVAMTLILVVIILHETRSVLVNCAKMNLPILGYIGKLIQKKEKKIRAMLDDDD